MAYRPNRRSNESPYGRGKLAFRKKGGEWQCQVQFSVDQETPFAGRNYRVEKWPDWVKPKKVSSHEWNIRLGQNEIFALSPWKGMFEGKVIGIAAKEGKKPTPKLKEYNFDGKDVSYLQFTILIEITNGLAGTIGATVPCTLRYNFGEDAEGNVEYTHYGANSKHSPRLDAVITAAGVWDEGEVKFSDNILPKLEKRMLKAGHTLAFQIKDGWINADSVDRVGGIDDTEEDDPLWDDED